MKLFSKIFSGAAKTSSKINSSSGSVSKADNVKVNYNANQVKNGATQKKVGLVAQSIKNFHDEMDFIFEDNNSQKSHIDAAKVDYKNTSSVDFAAAPAAIKKTDISVKAVSPIEYAQQSITEEVSAYLTKNVSIDTAEESREIKLESDQLSLVKPVAAAEIISKEEFATASVVDGLIMTEAVIEALNSGKTINHQEVEYSKSGSYLKRSDDDKASFSSCADLEYAYDIISDDSDDDFEIVNEDSSADTNISKVPGDMSANEDC